MLEQELKAPGAAALNSYCVWLAIPAASSVPGVDSAVVAWLCSDSAEKQALDLC